ncbi:MAG: hypothetical protein IJU70_00390 [Lentisphaeria bacterium]|nr:hypothetical protein [Lentisphaeria bacterium]
MFRSLAILFTAALCCGVFAKEYIVIVSDSTAVNYRGRKNPITKTASWSPMAGWGEYAADDVRRGVPLLNRSAGGYSSKTYCESILPKTKKAFKKDGWLLLSFGSNDSRPHPKFDRATKPESTFPQYMDEIASAAKAAGMKVVILSPLPFFAVSKGKFAPVILAPYAAACEKLAREKGYHYIDLYKLVCDQFADKSVDEIKSYYMFLKPGDSPNWPKGRSDNLHVNEKGAKMVWSLIRAAIDKDIPELAKLLKKEGEK